MSVAVAALAVAAALALVVVAVGRGGGETQKPLLPPGQALEVDGVISPGVSLFGDTLTARVDVILNRDRIDADDVRLKTAFAPYERVGPVEVKREDVGSETHLSCSIPLRCDDFACLPATPTAPGVEVPTRRAFRLQPARLSVQGTQIATQVAWKPVEVTSRVNETEPGGIRYRANLSPPPAVSYRIAPGALAAIALALAGGLALLAAVLIARAVRTLSARRPPALDLPPVERALWLLRRTGDSGDGEDRRRALELLAEALQRERHDELADAVRAVAWSHASPSAQDAESLAARVTTERGSNGRSR